MSDIRAKYPDTHSPVPQMEMTVYPVLDGADYDGEGIVIAMPSARKQYIFTLERK